MKISHLLTTLLVCIFATLPAHAKKTIPISEDNFTVSGRYGLAKAAGTGLEGKVAIQSVTTQAEICETLYKNCIEINSVFKDAANKSLKNYGYLSSELANDDGTQKVNLELQELNTKKLDNGFEISIQMNVSGVEGGNTCFPATVSSRFRTYYPTRASSGSRIALGLLGIFADDAERLAGKEKNSELNNEKAGTPASWHGLGEGYAPSHKEYEAIGHGVKNAMRLALVNFMHQIGSNVDCSGQPVSQSTSESVPIESEHNQASSTTLSNSR